MLTVTIQLDELAVQEAAAALDTSTAGDTIKRALAIATEVQRGQRLAERGRRLSRRRR
jgi:Arc/MetJ family transcription regulator